MAEGIARAPPSLAGISVHDIHLSHVGAEILESLVVGSGAGCEIVIERLRPVLELSLLDDGGCGVDLCSSSDGPE